MKSYKRFARISMLAGVATMNAAAQYGVSGGSSGGSGAVIGPLTGRLGFDRPESWALKYFASATLMSGLTPADGSPETRHPGSLTMGIEFASLPTLDSGQTRVGFFGTSPEDLNKAPIFVRPQLRVGLPWQLTAIVAGPPPFEVFGITSHILDLGLERPILERPRWTMGWRGYGQLGTVEGAFTCSKNVLGYAPGSFNNPESCTGLSADTATLHYVGSELQFAYRSPRIPKLVPHVASGVNYISAAFQVHAPLQGGLDQSRLWTRGFTASESGGVSYLVNRQMVFTVDAFYTPLWVQRHPGSPRTNDGLFNVRALIAYNFR